MVFTLQKMWKQKAISFRTPCVLERDNEDTASLLSLSLLNGTVKKGHLRKADTAS
jgi:hypothetical protein